MGCPPQITRHTTLSCAAMCRVGGGRCRPTRRLPVHTPPSEQRHAAHYTNQFVVVRYPFHPRYGQRLEVVGNRIYRNQTCVVVKIPSQGQVQVPLWMTEEPASNMSITTSPALSWRSLSNLSVYLKQINVLFSDNRHTSTRRRLSGRQGSTSVQPTPITAQPKTTNSGEKPTRSNTEVR